MRLQSYFYSAKYFIYSFVLLFSSVFYIVVLSLTFFVTLGTYFHILSLFIFSRVILLLICKIQFAFFRLENDLGEIETSSNVIANYFDVHHIC